MAYEIGTASGHLDLLDKLKTFLSTNAELVAAGQNWEVLRYGKGVAKTWPYSRIACGNAASLLSYTTTYKDALPSWFPAASQSLVQFTGTLNVTEAGSHTFSLDGIGSADILIDDTLVVSRYGTTSMVNNFTSSVGSVTLAVGAHTFKVRCLLNTSTYFGISVGMKTPSGSIGLMDTATYVPDLAVTVASCYQSAPTLKADMDTICTQMSLCLRGKGSGGTDNIYVNIFTSQWASSDYYNWSMSGATNFDANLKSLDQEGTCTAGVSGGGIQLWNGSIPYWFIANGRRFIVIAKVSTIYASLYGGFLLPYALPSEYPYPMFLGGSTHIPTVKWSTQNGVYGGYDGFWDSGAPSGAVFRDPYGNWLRIANRNSSSSGGEVDSTYPAETHPYFGNPGWRPSPDGSYVLSPVVVSTAYGRTGLPTTTNGTGIVAGELDGVYHVSGFNNAVENIITVGGVDHLVVQSTYKNGYNGFAAIALK